MASATLDRATETRKAHTVTGDGDSLARASSPQVPVVGYYRYSVVTD
jgi:hypothetical protein